MKGYELRPIQSWPGHHKKANPGYSVHIFLHLKFAAAVLLHCKKVFAGFLSTAGMLLTKLFLAGNNLICPGQGKFG
jgi:hypothetical protein